MSRYGQSYIPLFFLALLLTAGCLAAPAPVAAADPPACRTRHYDARGNVRFVIDGDTVVLARRGKVRLIGIDTPELGHDGAVDQPFARRARDFLMALLRQQHGQIFLVYDQQRRDHYHRLLAHLFLPDGTSVEARILARGLATPLTIPPNLGFLDCYRVLSQEAIDTGTGIWSLPQYRVMPVTALTGNERGYHRIRGTITHIGHSRTSVWLDMGRRLGLRIVKTDLKYFANLKLEAFMGRTVEARGMIYRQNGQLRIRIWHPVNIRLLKN